MGYYKKNNYAFNKSGFYRAGRITSSINVPIKAEDPSKNDRENRNNVLKSIEEYISKGKTLDEALEILSSDEVIKKQFEYLKRNGLDLRNTFKSWYESYKKSLKKPINWYTGGGKNFNLEEVDNNEYR